MIKAGIIGGAGYTAGELTRLLICHPEVELKWISSTSNAGNRVDSVHQGLIGETDLVFVADTPLSEIDVLFLCTPHASRSLSSKSIRARFQNRSVSSTLRKISASPTVCTISCTVCLN